jgi:hypothetical protein
MPILPMTSPRSPGDAPPSAMAGTTAMLQMIVKIAIRCPEKLPVTAA